MLMSYKYKKGGHYRTEAVKFVCRQEDGDTEEPLGLQNQTADVQTQR